VQGELPQILHGIAVWWLFLAENLQYLKMVQDGTKVAVDYRKLHTRFQLVPK